jgi:hypothetical protein
MSYLIGADEAGYGPNLGPLVIAVSAWRVPGDPRKCDLYEVLEEIVVRSAGDAGADGRLAIADSKALYKSGQTVGLLERGVLAALGALASSCQTSRALWSVLAPEACEHFDSMPWHVGVDCDLPMATCADDLSDVVQRLLEGFKAARAELVALRARAIFPAQFNALVEQYGNKAEALSRITLNLVGEVLELCGDGPVHAVCDKHGGRGNYQRLLQQQFPDPLIEVVREGMEESVYRWGPKKQRVEVCFRMNGETFLPVALASMTAKYLRELAMREFNAFWCQHIDGLKPTAGYYNDSQRFKRDIAAMQESLGIADHLLWRCR